MYQVAAAVEGRARSRPRNRRWCLGPSSCRKVPTSALSACTTRTQASPLLLSDVRLETSGLREATLLTAAPPALRSVPEALSCTLALLKLTACCLNRGRTVVCPPLRGTWPSAWPSVNISPWRESRWRLAEILRGTKVMLVHVEPRRKHGSHQRSAKAESSGVTLVLKGATLTPPLH